MSPVACFRGAMLAAAALLASTGSPARAETEKGRAVSLRMYQEKLRLCAPSQGCTEDFMTFSGLTTIMGYMVDGERRDVVLVGKVESGAPPLHLDDFVVALRNAYFKYARRVGETSYYSAPMCTIDPSRESLRRLASIGGNILGRGPDADLGQLIQHWEYACRQPMKVTVKGVPEYTRFARTMVEADYDLKALADGQNQVDIEGLVSHSELVLRTCRSDFVNGRPISASPSMMNRFWFAPGAMKIIDKNNVVLLKQWAVRLLTESELLKGEGERVASGARDRLAEKFAQDLTNRFDRLARERPVYAELDNLYRFVFIAKALRLREAFVEAQLDISFLLNDCPLPEAKSPGFLPGIASFAQTRVERDMGDQIAVGHFRLPSCGGVTMDIDVDRKLVVEDKRNEAPVIKKVVAESRPSADAATWDFEFDWED